ncbi:MurR/RpiR family transcriptional regulator [Roseovarius sp. SCSIO 43702]|uniref:MurR/RpiR family transcriptional regulator n=1 Tax=Roseovarius sp. SCSIO 43702 TaxID=2823043 RepID=UPI001C72E4F6|nr:MurR/RpiR family transcriptional regulator [Roseovarius sp. SCSIO 43702]QYX56787.1 MurR/RpiR family transcriptional regulator [Roseovarius sp. SCSIO 43702]
MTDETARERIAQARNLSKGEGEVALWVERHYDSLPFVNAAELAVGAGVSEMTVSRFVRRLGYRNFKAFKAAVSAEYRGGGGEGAGTSRASRVQIPPTAEGERDAMLRREIDAIVEVYDLASSAPWAAALDVVERAEHVNVTGFQGVKGMAMDFATRLKYARPGVRFTDGRSGTWSEIFIEEPEKSCLVMIEVVPYAHEAVKIADLCLRRNMPLVIITDRYGAWPRQYTPHVLSVATATRAFLDSMAGLSALLGLFLNSVAARRGAGTTERLEQMRALAEHFDPFSYDPGSKSRPILTRDDDKDRS